MKPVRTHPHRRGVLASALVAALFLSGCAFGPSSKTDLCASFDDLGSQLTRGNGVFGNPLFKAAGNLGAVAARFPDTSVTADGAQLNAVAKSDSTSIGELMNATQHIARVCGHQLSPF